VIQKKEEAAVKNPRAFAADAGSQKAPATGMFRSEKSKPQANGNQMS